jgi:hypothetical protein
MPERKMDSVTAMEERAAKIRAESDKIEREMVEREEKRKLAMAQREEEIRQVEDADVAQANLLSGIETREHLLQRIRELREEGPAEIVAPPRQLTETMQREFDAEQALGRAMVAKAEAEQVKLMELRARLEAEERSRAGHMTSVHQVNPSQDEPFPVNKATFGKPK